MSLFLGPGIARWTPNTWADIEAAATTGILDETHWVELKEAIGASKPANLELAKDLASLAVDGGMLVIGIQDDKGKAGAVVGTELTGLGDRIDQVARDRVHPPLVVRPIEIPHPTVVGAGCILVIVDAGVEAPHMVDDRYWGRGASGKRALPDSEVRRRFGENNQRRTDFQNRFATIRGNSPVRGHGVLHLEFTPRSGGPSPVAAAIDRPHELLARLREGVPRDPLGWSVDQLSSARLVVRGVDLTNFNAHDSASDILEGDASSIEAHFTALRVDEDGSLGLSMSRLIWTETTSGRPSERQVSTEGLASVTHQCSMLAARLGDLAGYGGTWDVGLAISGLQGARPAPRAGRYLAGYVEASYPDDRYTALTTTTTRELTSEPRSIARRLLQPAFRVLGVPVDSNLCF